MLFAPFSVCWYHSESSSLLFELLKMANSSLVNLEELINYEHVVEQNFLRSRFHFQSDGLAASFPD